QRARDIVSNTVSLAHQFCELLNLYPHQLLPKPGQGVHFKELKDFVEYVVLFEQSREWGKSGYPDEYTASTLPLFQALDVKDVSRDDLGGYGSWLYTGKILGTYSVIFDGAEITNVCAARRRDADDVKFRLFLHELGHFVLHREMMFPA